MKRPFIFSGIAGIAVIIMSIILMFVFPQKAARFPEGFFTPVIAFEFINTSNEVEAFFGPAGERESMAARMDLGNKLDYLYMALYCIFLFSYAFIMKKEDGTKAMTLAMAFCIFIFFADAMENIQLLSITDSMGNSDLSNELFLLKIFTWLKWGGLSVFFILVVPAWRRAGGFGRFLALWAIITLAAAIAALLHRGLMNELFALCVGLMFLFIIIFSFVHKGVGEPESDG